MLQEIVLKGQRLCFIVSKPAIHDQYDLGRMSFLHYLFPQLIEKAMLVIIFRCSQEILRWALSIMT